MPEQPQSVPLPEGWPIHFPKRTFIGKLAPRDELNDLDATVVENFLRYLRALNNDFGRRQLIQRVRDAYCFECGGEQSKYPGSRGCQCWNDE
jgi:hypothetical protein